MKRNKKAFIILVLSIVAVFAFGVVATTYAWFLSRYGTDYEFVLNSESPMVLRYETDLAFASGDISTGANILVPATEKKDIGLASGALDPLDVFDVDTVSPAHTGIVESAAQAVKYTASGAFWTGENDTVGSFTPELHVYLSSFLSSAALTTHLASFSEEVAVTEDNLISLLEEEEHEKTAENRLIARNDLVRQGEIAYILVIEYQGKRFLYYDGAYYVLGVKTGSDFTLPKAAESNDELRYWHDPTAENSTVNDVQLSDGDHLYLQPNTTFSFTLYAFMARTDEKRDAEINAGRVTLYMSMLVEEVVEETPAEPVEP